MKRLITMLAILTLAAVMAIPSYATTIAFGVLTDEEDNYIVDSYNEGVENEGIYFDGDAFRVYKFTFNTGDTEATLTMPLASGFMVSVSTDYSEESLEGSFTVVKKQELPDENDPNWWTVSDDPMDLSSFLPACKNNTIYVKISDVSPENGFGGYLYYEDTHDTITDELVGSKIIFVSSGSGITDIPTEPVTDAPTEPVTDAPTDAATEAQTEPETKKPETDSVTTNAITDKTTEKDETKSENNSTAIIIAAVAAAVVIVGIVCFIIIKKKKA